MYLNSIRRTLAVLTFASCALSSAGRAMGQAVTGTIVGTVTDTSGAAMVNATVVISLTGQNFTHTTTTNESGNFTEPSLSPGTYSVVITASGFKKQTYENIAV